MRNLLEHPITAAEIISAIEPKPENEILVGGLDRLCQHLVTQYLIDHPEVLHDIVESARV